MITRSRIFLGIITLTMASTIVAAPTIYNVNYAPGSEQPMNLNGSIANVSVYSSDQAPLQTQATINGQQMAVNYNNSNAVARITSFENQPNNTNCSGASEVGGQNIDISCDASPDSDSIRNFISR